MKYSTRLVIILKNIVIKIPVCRKGYLQGLNEKKIWDIIVQDVNNLSTATIDGVILNNKIW